MAGQFRLVSFSFNFKGLVFRVELTTRHFSESNCESIISSVKPFARCDCLIVAICCCHYTNVLSRCIVDVVSLCRDFVKKNKSAT